MGESQLFAATAALTLAALAVGQGPVYREAWGYMHLEERRFELLAALRTAGAGGSVAKDTATDVRATDVRAAVAEALAAPSGGVPFLPVAKALALTRGVAADPAFVLRAMMGAYVLPEVCDPDGTHPSCRDVAVTAFLPYPMALPGAIALGVEVVDAGGKTVFTGSIERDTDLEGLRLGRSSLQVPGKDLPDGRYTMRLLTRIDGAGPRPTDPTLNWTFHVMRGYQQRAERAMGRARDHAPKLPVQEREVLTALSAAVLRAYTGEPFVGASEGVADLAALEAVVGDGEPKWPVPSVPSASLPLWLDVGDPLPLRCLLRRASKPARPLVVLISGSPTYDPTLYRPAGPAARDPAWLQREFGDFGVSDDWHVAFVQSPGDGRSFAQSIAAALPKLVQRTGGKGQPVALVCEREAAAAVALRLPTLEPLPAAVVLCGSGGMPGATVDALGRLPVRLVRLHGFPGSDGLQRIREYLAARPGSAAADIDWLTPDGQPWALALPLLQEPLRAFLLRVFAG